MKHMAITGEDLRNAALDGAAIEARRIVAPALADAFDRVGPHLECAGEIFGGDRVAGRSPFKNGDDAAVACGRSASAAGALCRGVIALLDAGNPYAAGALVRQLVEIEYLVWCFATEPTAAAAWLRSSSDERRKHWGPASLRKRANKVFRSNSYWSHCELGGHLTPVLSGSLLYSSEVNRELMWPDFISHAAHAWEGLVAAAKDHTEFNIDLLALTAKEPRIAVANALDHWYATDYFLTSAARAAS